MNKLPQMASVADLKHRHLEVFARAAQGPVVVANRSKPAVVIVAPALWDNLMQQLEDLQDVVDTLQAELELATGEDKLIDADLQKLKRMAHGAPVPA